MGSKSSLSTAFCSAAFVGSTAAAPPPGAPVQVPRRKETEVRTALDSPKTVVVNRWPGVLPHTEAEAISLGLDAVGIAWPAPEGSPHQDLTATFGASPTTPPPRRSSSGLHADAGRSDSFSAYSAIKTTDSTLN